MPLNPFVAIAEASALGISLYKRFHSVNKAVSNAAKIASSGGKFSKADGAASAAGLGVASSGLYSLDEDGNPTKNNFNAIINSSVQTSVNNLNNLNNHHSTLMAALGIQAYSASSGDGAAASSGDGAAASSGDGAAASSGDGAAASSGDGAAASSGDGAAASSGGAVTSSGGGSASSGGGSASKSPTLTETMVKIAALSESSMNLLINSLVASQDVSNAIAYARLYMDDYDMRMKNAIAVDTLNINEVAYNNYVSEFNGFVNGLDNDLSFGRITGSEYASMLAAYPPFVGVNGVENFTSKTSDLSIDTSDLVTALTSIASTVGSVARNVSDASVKSDEEVRYYDKVGALAEYKLTPKEITDEFGNDATTVAPVELQARKDLAVSVAHSLENETTFDDLGIDDNDLDFNNLHPDISSLFNFTGVWDNLQTLAANQGDDGQGFVEPELKKGVSNG